MSGINDPVAGRKEELLTEAATARWELGENFHD